MSWFQNLTIRSKVMTAFATILVVTAILGVFAINRLSAVNDNVIDLADNYLVASSALAEVDYNSMRFRQLQAAHALAPTPEAKAKEVETMRGTVEGVRKAWDQYAPTIDPGEEKGLAAKVMPAWNAYVALNDKFIALSSAGQTAAATALYTGEMRDAFHAFGDALQADQDYQLKAGAKKRADSAETYSQSRSMILGALGLAVALCVGAGWMIVSGVSTPIRAMTGAMMRLAQHDLTTVCRGCGAQGRNRPDGRRRPGLQGQHDRRRPSEGRAGGSPEGGRRPRSHGRPADPRLRHQRAGRRAVGVQPGQPDAGRRPSP